MRSTDVFAISRDTNTEYRKLLTQNTHSNGLARLFLCQQQIKRQQHFQKNK